MFVKLFIVFSIIPLVELYLLIKVGSVIGALPTIAIVVTTALCGAYLAKKQGISTFARIRQQLSSGVIPEKELINGVLILIAAVLLLTPGVLTDVFGIALLVPLTRDRIREMAGRFIRTKIGRIR